MFNLFFGVDRPGAGARQIASDDLEDAQQFFLIVRRQTGERFGARRLADLSHLLEHGIGGVMQEKAPGAPILWIRTPLDQASGLAAVNQADKGDGLDVHELRQRTLLNSLVALEHEDQLPLGAGQNQPAAARPLLEPLPHQAGGVVHEEAKGGIGRQRGGGVAGHVGFI